MTTRVVLAFGVFCACGNALLAQNSASPAFEVASIRPTKTFDTTYALINPGGRFTAINLTLRGLILRAYQLQDASQIEGGPDWVDREGFDIQAKADGNRSPTQVWLMVRNLLSDRFKLTLLKSTKEAPIYVLTLKNDGKTGPKLQPASGSNCVVPPSSVTITSFDRNKPACGVLYSPLGRWIGRGVPLNSVANALTRTVRRVVVNRTKLSGTFDLDLEWTDLSALFSNDPAGPNPPLPADGPSLTEALEEQLGLKLESSRGPIDLLIIEHAQRPDPN